MGRELQTLVQLIYPSQCVTCDALVEEDFALCGPCWRDTHFIEGLACDACGVPLPGSGEGVLCDDCLRIARPWRQGRAALMYRDNGRKIALALKHGDRTDYAKPAARWMAAKAPPLRLDAVIVPVPLHWRRFLKRRYNQSAVLARALARLLQRPVIPDALLRPRATKPLDGISRDARFAALQDAITANPRRAAQLQGRQVLLVDDVMTSGATLGAATEALQTAGADHVDVLVLARVAKDA